MKLKKPFRVSKTETYLVQYFPNIDTVQHPIFLKLFSPEIRRLIYEKNQNLVEKMIQTHWSEAPKESNPLAGRLMVNYSVEIQFTTYFGIPLGRYQILAKPIIK